MRGLTHFGGVFSFINFSDCCNPRFCGAPCRYHWRNCRYTVPQMMLALVYAIVLNLDRLETASFLRFNGTLQYLTGLPSFPDPQTLLCFLSPRTTPILGTAASHQ